MIRIRSFAVAAIVLAVAAASVADTITVGSATVEPATTVSLPVHLRDVSGTTLGAGSADAVHGISLKFLVEPAAAVSSIEFERAGVLAALTPRFERTLDVPGGVAYLVSFPAGSPVVLTGDAPAPGDRIGTLIVGLAPTFGAGRSITVTVDRATAALSNESGTKFETPYNGLVVNDAVIETQGDPTSTALTVSPNPAEERSPVTLVATVTSPVAGTITGMVTFLDNDAVLATVPLMANGKAELSTTTLAFGSHFLSARYHGDLAYSESVSSGIPHNVYRAPFRPPTDLAATALSTSTIELRWSAVNDGYYFEIYRSSSLKGGWIYLGTSYSGSATSWVDPNLTPATAYRYFIRAWSVGLVSGESNRDMAVTMMFANDPLVPGGTGIKLDHLTSLRAAVTAARVHAGLPAMTLTDPSPTTGTPVRIAHVTELRTGLNEARSALGLPAFEFTDSVLSSGMPIRAVHFQQLRDAVK